MNYPFLMRHDMQPTREISYRFESTACISEVSWYVDWIEVEVTDDFMSILEANWPQARCDINGLEIIRS